MQAPHDDVSQPTFVPVSDEPLAQHVDEQVTWLDLDLVTGSVDSQRYCAQGNLLRRRVRSSLLLRRGRARARRIVPVMIEIREIDAGRARGLARPSRDAVRPDRTASVGDYVDWKRQAEDMAWFIASKAGEDAGAALAYVGWHSTPGTGYRRGLRAARAPRRRRRIGALRAARRWVQERGCITLETTVAEDDAGSLAWVDRRGFREVGRNSKMVLDLTAIEAPAIDPPEGVEIVTWAERPDLGAGPLRGGLRGVPGRPGRGGRRWTHSRMALEGHEGDERPARRDVRCARRRRGGRYAKLSLSSADSKVAYHDMTGVRRAFRGRGIARALKRTQIAWAKQRATRRSRRTNEVAKRADPPPQPAPRVHGCGRGSSCCTRCGWTGAGELEPPAATAAP